MLIAIVVLDLDQGGFSEANRQACALFGLSRDELLKQGPIQMSPELQPDGRPSAEAAMEAIGRALQGETPSFEWTHRDAQGRNILCRVQLARVHVEGRKLVRGSIIDISAHKETEHYKRWRERVAEWMAEPRQGIAYNGIRP